MGRFDGVERGLQSQLGGFRRSKHLKAESQRERRAIDTSDAIWEITGCLLSDVQDGGQCAGRMDGEDMVTAAREEGIVSGGEIAGRRRGSGRLGFKGGQLSVKLFTRDVFSIHI